MAIIVFCVLLVLVTISLLIRSRLFTSSRPRQPLSTDKLSFKHESRITPPKTPVEDTTAAVEIKIEPLPDFDWTKVEPEKHRPFKPTYHITMALKNSTPSDLVQMDKNYLSRIINRQAIVRDHESTVLGYIPEGIPAIYEVYEYLLGTYLPIRFPTMFSLQTSSSSTGTNITTFHNHVTSLVSPVFPPPSDPLTALRILSQTIEDDFFLMHLQPANSPTFPNEHKTVAFICCHPAGFDPSTKLAKGLKVIHVPVPSYSKIGPSMERFFSRTTVDKPVKRLNWSVQTHSNLYSPGGNHVHAEEAETVEKDIDVDIETARFRVELQTLTRLPRTGGLMFSFKTYLYGLQEIKEEGLGEELADAVEGLGKGNAPGMWVYKGGVRWGKKVCEYLRS
ncbi:Protein of unknown function (DUF3445) domain containing protein [Naviculisporaceae sp. PSN 640]